MLSRLTDIQTPTNAGAVETHRYSLSKLTDKTIVFIPGVALANWDLRGYEMPLVLFLAVIVRPWFMGIYVSRTQLVVRGWYWHHRYRLQDVAWASDERYVGILNLGRAEKSEPLYRWCRSICAKCKGRVRSFPSTINSRKTSDRVVVALRAHIAEST